MAGRTGTKGGSVGFSVKPFGGRDPEMEPYWWALVK